MLRAIILSMVLFLALATIIPIATEQTEAGSVQQQKRKVKKKQRAAKYRRYRKYRRSQRYRASRRAKANRRYRRAVSRNSRKKRSVRRYRKSRNYTAKRRATKPRVRKYSKKWWRQYRARKARRNAVARRKRSLRIRRVRLAKQKQAAKARRLRSQNAAVQKNIVGRPAQTAILPSGNPAPAGWLQNDVNSSSLLFNVDGANGLPIGSAALTVLGPATGQTVVSHYNPTVGGVSTTTLRRTVIDQMIRENGWVENDYQKEIAGKPVYVVVAKSADQNNRVQARTYYFTEANGRIYSLATKSSKEDSEKIVRQSEKVIESLQNRGTKVQTAKND